MRLLKAIAKIVTNSLLSLLSVRSFGEESIKGKLRLAFEQDEKEKTNEI